MIRFLSDNRWVEFDSMEQICNLFVTHDDIMIIAPRTDPITLEDGTIITPTSAVRILLTIAVQKHLDKEAQKKQYDTIYTAALRAGYTGPFHDEGVKYATWMDSVWAYVVQVFADVDASIRTLPTSAELLLELPVFVP